MYNSWVEEQTEHPMCPESHKNNNKAEVGFPRFVGGRFKDCFSVYFANKGQLYLVFG